MLSRRGVATPTATSGRRTARSVLATRSSAQNTPRMTWWTSSTGGGHTSCNKWSYYSFAGRGRAREFCAQHAGEGMIFGARNQCGEEKASTAGGQVGSPAKGKTARRVVGDGGKQRCTATPSNQPAASSGVQKSNKQARAAVDGAAAASSPVAGGTTSAPEPGSEGEGAAAAETASLALGSTVKDEPAAACNVETAEFQGVSMSSTTWATQPTQRYRCVALSKDCCFRCEQLQVYTKCMQFGD